jgi:hypothetical protein
MIDLEILTQLGLAGGLLTYIWNDAKKRNENTEIKVEVLSTKVELLDKRLQKTEDIQGTKLDIQADKIDEFSSDLKEFKHDVNEKLEALRVALHKEKNMEGQLNQTLTLILREFEKRNEDN